MNNISKSIKKKFKRTSDKDDIVVIEEGGRIPTSEELQDEESYPQVDSPEFTNVQLNRTMQKQKVRSSLSIQKKLGAHKLIKDTHVSSQVDLERQKDIVSRSVVLSSKLSGNHKEIMLDPASPDDDIRREKDESSNASESNRETSNLPKNIYALCKTTKTTNTEHDEKEPSLDRQFDTYAVYKQMLSRRSKVL